MPTELRYDAETGEDELVAYIPPPAPVPREVYPLQIRKALRASGLHAAVSAFIAGQSDEVKESWEYASIVTRDNALIEAGRVSLGLSVKQVDDLFKLAATL